MAERKERETEGERTGRYIGWKWKGLVSLPLGLGGGYGQEVRCVVIDIQNVYNKIIYCAARCVKWSFRALFGVGIMIKPINCARPSLRVVIGCGM